MIRFIVPGQPLPTERPRSGPQGGRLYTPPASLAAQAGVRAAFKAQVPGHRLGSPCWAWALRLMYYRESMVTADLDNLEKTVLDGLSGVLWVNDRQVWDIHHTRYLGAGKGQGQTIVEARVTGTLADTRPRP